MPVKQGTSKSLIKCHIKILKLCSRFNATLGALRRQNLNGIYDPHTNVMHYPSIMQPTHARWEQIDDYEVEFEKSDNGVNSGADEHANTLFTPVKPIYSRNYMIIDTVCESAPSSNLGVPGPDGNAYDVGFNGLASVPDEIKAELPPECLKAFEETLAKEMEWKQRWKTEAADTNRRAPAIDKGLIM